MKGNNGKGSCDKKDEPWWPKMHSFEDLIETCTIIIWIASTLHVVVNFGHYSYGSYPPSIMSLLFSEVVTHA